MSTRTCREPECARKVVARGLCSSHYNKRARAGQIKPVTPADRFWAQVDKAGPDECWEWTGRIVASGYASGTKINGKREQGHRAAYLLLVGPIPEGLHLDHLCRNTKCVNPNHLEPVTPRENVLRGVSFAAEYGKRTHCNNEHEFTPENTRWRKNGGRECLECRKEWNRQRYTRNKGAA